jgi:hypothetical protein
VTVLFSHLRLGFVSGLFPCGFPTKILYADWGGGDVLGACNFTCLSFIRMKLRGAHVLRRGGWNWLRIVSNDEHGIIMLESLSVWYITLIEHFLRVYTYIHFSFVRDIIVFDIASNTRLLTHEHRVSPLAWNMLGFHKVLIYFKLVLADHRGRAI